MNTIFRILALGMAVALIGGCSDSVNTEKPKEPSWEDAPKLDIPSLTRRAEAGDAVAQSELGKRNYLGSGVPKDSPLAVTWFRKAAEQGLAKSQFNLGQMYINGEGVSKDAAQAVAWYRKAAEQGHADAQFALGWAYDSGEGVSKDAPQAVAWYRKAAEQGSADAQFALGQMYGYGEGVTKDAVQAVAWYRKAAEQGLAVAQNRLGEMYADGDGVPKDAVQAASWYRKAAEQGQVDAQFRLGLEYAFGTGVPNDFIRAYMWTNLAAAQGGETAKIASALRDDISRRMSPEQIAEAQRLTREWKPGQHTESPSLTGGTSGGAMEKAMTGTAFVVSNQGHLLTNRHIVGNCQQVRLAGSDKPLKVLPQDEANDLALLQMTGKPKAVAVFRAANDLRQGESIAAYGYPLLGTLAAGGNLSPGVVSALAGLGNNTSQIQITAPVQQGNSGGPVLDSKGQVVGVVVQKLDAVKVAKLTGDVPQNVNFAINESTTRAFLDSNQVGYKTGNWWNVWQKDLTEIAEDARDYTVVVECWK